MKLSLYKNGTEVAWVTFHKPGDSVTDHADWFQSANVIASSPWDPDLLRESTTVFNIDPDSQ